MPKISIIVPVYKVEKYLHRCLDSIVNQTFTDLECILVDDGSPDNSGRICDEYAKRDKRFRVFHQANAGVSAARNKGLDEARGEWIVFVDSDDWIEKEMLADLYECAVNNLAEVVMCGRKLYSGNKIRHKYAPKSGWLDLPTNFVNYLQGPWAKLFSRRIIDIIRFPEGIALSEDLYFVVCIILRTNKIYGIDKMHYAYCVNFDSAIQTLSENKILNQIDVIKQIEKDLNVFQPTNIKEWKKWLDSKKIQTKMLFITRLNPPNYSLWWKYFPEVSYNFKSNSLKRMLLHILIICRLYFIIKLVKKCGFF